jgi:hypothetical protein
LQVRDGGGTPIAVKGLQVTFSLEGDTTAATISPTTDNGDGTYAAKLTSRVAGATATVRAHLGSEIVASSATVRIKPADPEHRDPLPSAARSTVTVRDSVVSTGSTTTLVFQVRDSGGVPLATKGLVVAFSLEGGTSTATIGPTTDNGDGTYAAELTGIVVGTTTTVRAHMGSEVVASSAKVRICSGLIGSITVTPPGILSSGETVRFNAVVRDRNGKELPDQHVTWSILNPAVATVNPETGDLTPSVTFGQATVAATVDGVSGYAMLTAASPGGAQVSNWSVGRFNPLLGANYFIASWGFSKTEVYVIGTFLGSHAGGPQLMYRWNGTGWDSLSLHETNSMQTVWGSSSHDLFVAGDNGVVQHYDGTSWTRSVTGDAIGHIWGSAPNDVWASTSVGLKHYDGKAWTTAASSSEFGGSVALQWGFSSADIYATGSGGIYHFDGSRWTLIPGSYGVGCGKKIWGTGYTNLYCLGSKEVYRFNGSEWTALGLPAGIVSARDIWGSSASDIYVVCSYFQILGYDGTSWRWYSGNPVTFPPGTPYTYGGYWTIWGIGTAMFTIGDEGFGTRGGDAVAPRDSLTT